MNVFYQPNDFNERLSSLLSAVLQRRLRPEFTAAIRRHQQAVSTGSSVHRPAVKVVCLVPAHCKDLLERTTKEFSKSLGVELLLETMSTDQNVNLFSIVE